MTKKSFPPLSDAKNRAHIKSMAQYEEMYRRSLEDSDAFWLEQAETLDWAIRPKIACEYTWESAKNNIHHSWFKDGFLNISENCLDRHLKTSIADKTAILWQGDSDLEERSLTYRELHLEVCKFSNVLKAKNIRKGDRVCIYMPMVPEAAIAMLSCARIGAIHSVVFGGFSPESLCHRIKDSGSKLLITANVSLRGGKEIPLKEMADEALCQTDSIESVIVYQRNETKCSMQAGRDYWYHDLIKNQPAESKSLPLNAEDPLFILYTSGSTGQPKGVLHTQGGYLLHASLSHKYIFDLQDDDVYWCTADVGWITGHSYVVYGPLANGATTLMFEGAPLYPTPHRLWQIIEKYKVSIFYTAPTVIRTLIAKGAEMPHEHDLKSLRILGSVGEPINPESWLWYHEVVGNRLCPIMDTWWQTETGGILISPMPASHTLKPGSVNRPFFGVDPIVLSSDNTRCPKNESGSLCFCRPWPGIMRTTWKDHDRFIENYFKSFPNHYFSGDGCLVDDDGDYWMLGRIDDVLNISGHRLGTAEIESALVSHKNVAEAAVVPIPDPIKGQGIYAFVTLIEGFSGSPELEKELGDILRTEIGPIAILNKIQFAKMLPKTRSGKIMRRILKKIAIGSSSDLGDTSTLADQDVIADLIAGLS